MVDAPAKARPVPDGLIRKILQAGTCAANGGNMQQWRFLVVKDPRIKKAVAAFYKRAWDEGGAALPRRRAGPRHGSGALFAAGRCRGIPGRAHPGGTGVDRPLSRRPGAELANSIFDPNVRLGRHGDLPGERPG